MAAKAKQGIVLSVKSTKTAVVTVASARPHPLYFKTVRRTKKFHVHDELGVAKGDLVEFVETKPFSRTKRWIITKVITKEEKPAKTTAKKRSPSKTK